MDSNSLRVMLDFRLGFTSAHFSQLPACDLSLEQDLWALSRAALPICHPQWLQSLPSLLISFVGWCPTLVLFSLEGAPGIVITWGLSGAVISTSPAAWALPGACWALQGSTKPQLLWDDAPRLSWAMGRVLLVCESPDGGGMMRKTPLISEG